MPGMAASTGNMTKSKTLSWLIYTLTTVIGIVAFLYPFWMPALQQGQMGMAHSKDAPLMLTALVGLAFAVLLLEIQSQSISAKSIALLGVLVAINTTLRFVDVAIPGPGGFTPIFFLIVLTGYVFGGRFGFLMGVLTLGVSSLVTGTVGPWLPYQMFTAGWMGLSAPLCRPFVRAMQTEGRWGEVVVLVIFGGVWGLLYGVIMNIWFWPFVSGSANQYWEPGISLLDTLRRYAVFYMATSFLWDSMRLVGNTVLIAAFGMPTLRVLCRFQQRFAFTYTPAKPVTETATPGWARPPRPVAMPQSNEGQA
jgi:energy-coupling factor transport system substrate-specific component